MDLTSYTDTDLDALRIAALTEQERRQRLRDAPSQAAALAGAFEQAIGTPDPVTWDGDERPDYLWGPGVIVTHAGKTWRNGSGVFLNGHYIPGDPAHPFWSELPGDTDTPTPWATGMHLTPDMFVSNGGHVYQYKGNDTPSAPANWAPTGTVSTATWMFIS